MPAFVPETTAPRTVQCPFCEGHGCPECDDFGSVIECPSWIDDLMAGFTAWLAAQPPEVRAQEQHWWDLVAEGLPAWLGDQPPEVSEAMGWQERVDLYLKDST